ncbi:hypothetical protein AAMO2058_001410500 [Amorphochlora amoebiformis]
MRERAPLLLLLCMLLHAACGHRTSPRHTTQNIRLSANSRLSRTQNGGKLVRVSSPYMTQRSVRSLAEREGTMSRNSYVGMGGLTLHVGEIPPSFPSEIPHGIKHLRLVSTVSNRARLRQEAANPFGVVRLWGSGALSVQALVASLVAITRLTASIGNAPGEQILRSFNPCTDVDHVKQIPGAAPVTESLQTLGIDLACFGALAAIFLRERAQEAKRLQNFERYDSIFTNWRGGECGYTGKRCSLS